jgi:outer membrane protein, multidrug efflux system
MRHIAVGLLMLAVIGPGCMRVGPDYKRPAQDVPAAFSDPGPWKQVVPADALVRGNWWELFGDPDLNRLEEGARQASPRLQAAAARVRQARAILGYAEANKLPTIDLAPTAARFAVSGNRPDQPSKVPGNTAYVTNQFRLPLYAAYEPDLWGKLSRIEESAGKRLEASIASYQVVLLSLQGDLAQTYFQLRAADQELALLRRSIELRTRVYELVAARKRGGLASELDLTRVETELAITESEVQAAESRRTELQHALAVLAGAVPGQFSLPPREFTAQPPAIPIGLPSDLLERRPDVAEAERVLAARSAEIGVAEAAMFPSIRLTGGVGVESADLSDLLNSNSRIWGLGVSLVQPLFDGGRIRANTERAKQAYVESLALYHQQILVAFRDVESTLAALRILDLQHEAQIRALTSAEKAERLATVRYKTGLTTVLELVDAERTRLQVDRSKLQIRNQQLLASVALIRALGGGWEGQTKEAADARAVQETTKRAGG